ncbi:hypothetical protein Syun_020901 [Stephania yunnanensis]|uniref:Uncharacterized protein n=1 Tax=Stephania yunnanensis TaxID=152371 RepID=A0AAP0IEN1_9MAGN
MSAGRSAPLLCWSSRCSVGHPRRRLVDRAAACRPPHDRSACCLSLAGAVHAAVVRALSMRTAVKPSLSLSLSLSPLCVVVPYCERNRG